MASTLIHIAVAKEINKVLNRDEYKLLLGSAAPDLAKLVGDPKTKSHFIKNEQDIPVLRTFINKYGKDLSDDFVMGYYIHLYTDYLWFKYFITELEYKNSVRKLDGTIIEVDDDKFTEYVYNDYTSLNVNLIDTYNIPVDLFYGDMPKIKNIIKEIPMDKLYLLTNKTGEILINARDEKSIIFDMTNVNKFIKLSTDVILSEIKKLGY